MSRNLLLNIMKPQDSLCGSEQTQISSAPLARMLFVYEKRKCLLLRIQKLCDSTNISTPLEKKTGTFLLETFSSEIQFIGLIWS